MTDNDTLTGLIERIINPLFKYSVPRIGKVADVADEDNEGKILVLIPSLGWDTNEKGAWCYPIDKKALIIPKVSDFVIVEWLDRNQDIPVYRGIATNLLNQLPSIYSGDPNFSVLFESNAQKIAVTYDETEDVMQIGKNSFSGAARIDDTITSSSAEDSDFWLFWSTFLGIVTGTPINEPGNGAPSVFQATLSAALNPLGTPTQIDGKINSGSSQVKIGDKQ